MALLTGAGRIGRLHYFLINLACGIGVFSPLLIGTEVDPATGEAPPPPTALLVIVLILALAGAWVSVTASIRRLHDCGRSGWTLLLTMLPFFGFGLSLYLLFSSGDAVANRYGPPPGGPDPETMKSQLAQMEAVIAPYRRDQPGAGTGGDSDPSAPAPSAWPGDATAAPAPLTFDPMALYRENPGLAPPTDARS